MRGVGRAIIKGTSCFSLFPQILPSSPSLTWRGLITARHNLHPAETVTENKEWLKCEPGDRALGGWIALCCVCNRLFCLLRVPYFCGLTHSLPLTGKMRPTRIETPTVFCGLHRSAPFWFAAHADAITSSLIMKLQHTTLGLSPLCNNHWNLRCWYGVYRIPSPRLDTRPLLHVVHHELIGKAASVDVPSGVSLALPRRCQQQMAKQAPRQHAWPPCLWMALLWKVAVRTLEKAAINTI